MKIQSSAAPLSQPRNYAPVGAVGTQSQSQTTQSQPQSVQAEGVLSGIKHFFIEVGNALKGLWNRMFPPPLTADEKAIASQYHLLPTKENIYAFQSEAHSYETDSIMGPGCEQADQVKTLQTALKDLGYAAEVNGSYDEKTMDAVIAFKKSEGIHQTYKGEDGNWVVNEYATQPTLEAIMKRLESR